MNHSAAPKQSASEKKGLAFRAAALLAVVAGGAAALFSLDVQSTLQAVLGWVAGVGPAGIALFVGLYIVACLLMLPGSILTLGAGALFGLLPGFLAVLTGASLGAAGAFLTGRYLARDWVSRKIGADPRFRAVDEIVGREGWKIVLLTRLSPLFPFNILNYSYGLTQVRLRDYFFASLTGMIPGTLLYTYLGSLAGDLANLGAGRAQRTPAEWALYGVGLLAAAAVTVFVTRQARKALARRIS